MSTLLIGASGLLGRHLRLSGDVFMPSSSELDITNKYSILKYLHTHHCPKKVVLCAAYTDVAKANAYKDLAFSTNVIGVCNVISALEEICLDGPILTYISSDYVFNGEYGQYKISDPIDPVKNNYYATTKALGECSARSYKNSIIIRTSFCRSDIWPHVAAFEDQFTSRDTVDIIAPMISDVIKNNRPGIFHVGTERKSVFSLAKKINANIKPMSRLEIKNVNIPYDTSLI